jgi:hypothetical protein
MEKVKTRSSLTFRSRNHRVAPYLPRLSAWVVSLLALVMLQSPATAIILTTNQVVDWRPGVPGGIPVYAQAINIKNAPYNATGNGTTDDRASIVAAIAACPTSGAIYFPPGTYLISAAINVNAPKAIVLRGAGPASTTLLFNVASTSFAFEPQGSGGTEVAASSGYTRNSTNIVLSSAAGFSIGDYCYISQDNDPAWMQGNIPSTTGRYQRQMFRITGIAANTISINRALYYTYNAAMNVKVRRIDPIVGFGCEDMKFDFRGAISQAGIEFYYSSGCWLKNVETYSLLPITHVNMDIGFRNEIRDSYFHQGMAGFTSQAPYGLSLGTGSSDNLVENNIYYYLRHGIVIQDGANGNVAGYNYAIRMFDANYPNTDYLMPSIECHGGESNWNLIEGNIATELMSDDYWGSNHNNTYFRNYAVRYSQGEAKTVLSGMYALRIDQYNQHHNLVANVSCTPGVDGTGGAWSVTVFGDDYASLDPTTPPQDPSVVSTMVYTANFDHISKTIQYDPAIADHTPTNSYYLASKPSWFGAMAWPAIGPDIAASTNANVASAVLIPAQARFLGVGVNPVKLGFSNQPQNGQASVALAPSITVTAYDPNGVPVSSYVGSVTVAIGNNPGGGTLSGTTTATAFQGIATFSNLSINNAGSGYTLVATAASMTSATSAAFNIAAALPNPPPPPVLVSPSNNASSVSTTPTLTWNPSPSATGYRVQVATDSGFTAVVADQVLNTTSYVPTPALSTGTTYFWHVLASNAGGNSAYSGTFTFSTSVAAPGVPTLVSPANAATGVSLTPTLTWNSVFGATSYQVQVATNSGFTGTVVTQSGLTSTNYVPPTLSTSTAYFWHVLARNSGGDSSYSVTRTFTTSPPPAPAAPTLVSPADLATNVSIVPVLSWTSVATATSYQIQVATNSGFTGTVISQAGLTSTSYAPTLTYNRQYFWHVLASNAGGNGSFSTARSFTTTNNIPPAPPAPSLNSPADTATGVSVTPTLVWDRSTNAVSYRIQVATDAGFTAIVADQLGITGQTYAPAVLANSTAYFWHVLATNTGGTSSYSTAFSFTTEAAPPPPLPVPGAPTLATPLNSSTNISVVMTFTWFGQTNTVGYHLQVSTVSNFGTTVIDQSGIGSQSFDATLLNGTIYFWRVSGINATGEGSFSSAFTFTTVPAAPAAPLLMIPAPSAVNVSIAPTLQWGTVPNAGSYGLQVATDAGFGSLVVSLTNLATTIYVPTLTTGTTYFWRANAANSGGTGGYSGTRTFTTVPTIPSVPTLSSPANGAVGISPSPVVSWNPSPGAAAYRVQISTVANFASTVYDVTGVLGLTFAASLANSTTYFWRVSAANAGGTSAFATAFSFTTVAATPAVPSLVTPLDGATGQSTSPPLNWTVSPGAVSYRLQLSTSPTFVTTNQDIAGIPSTVYRPPVAFATTYYWRVNASSSGGTSAFSVTRSFTTQAAAPVPPPLPLLNTRARLLMMIDKQGRWYKSNTSITNNGDALLTAFSFYVPGDWLTNQYAHMHFPDIPGAPD